MEVDLIDSMGTDLTVCNAARVSFNKETELIDGELQEKDRKLISYLAKHRHMSPFGHCFATVRVKAPIFVARQLQKHAYLRMNEVSRRYVSETPQFFRPGTWRAKAGNKKQGSSEEGVDNQNTWHNAYNAALNNARWLYEDMLNVGVCPEQARMILPQSCYTEWYWSGSMDALANMCNLRCKSDTQYETRLIADKIDKLLELVWPVSWKELRNID